MVQGMGTEEPEALRHGGGMTAQKEGAPTPAPQSQDISKEIDMKDSTP